MYDFEKIGKELLYRAPDILPSWLPGGKMRGHEYVCANLRGGNGESLSINMQTGKWADFAGTEKGSDLISLYAAIYGLSQIESAKKLSESLGVGHIEPIAKKEQILVSRPPSNNIDVVLDHYKYGKPVGQWLYSDAQGPLFYISRYECGGKKQILPWSWSNGKWVQKGWPAPRPLYKLPEILAAPEKPVMIVEGEKCAEAAQIIVGDTYIATTWPNGANAVDKSAWDALRGRKVLIWPDADDPGIKAAHKIAVILGNLCPEVKIIDVFGMPDKWDAADAVRDGWTWEKLKEWAKPRIKVASTTAYSVSRESQPQHVVAAAQANVSVTINNEETETSLPAKEIWDKLGLAQTSHGVVCNLDNVLRVLENHDKLSGVIWYDTFQRKFFTDWHTKKTREWEDVDSLNLLAYMQRDLGMRKVSDTMVQQAVVIYGRRHTRNSPKEWMDSLKWDGAPRINDFLIECLGADETVYSRSASKNFWLSMVARVFKPGCQVDNMIILEGAQGIGKTKVLRLIGGDWYTEAHESVTNKDFFMALNGKIIVEIAELDAFSKAEVTRIKQVVSCSVDRYRSPYGRFPMDIPRMNIFVGTTNEKNYLRDNTGARRFWPINCRRIDLELVNGAREQMFAEAVYRFKNGEDWYSMPAEETLIEQEKRRQVDDWEEVIENYVFGKSEITIVDIATSSLNIDISRLDRMTQLRIGGILRKLGWEKHNLLRNGKQKKTWVNTKNHYIYQKEMDI